MKKSKNETVKTGKPNAEAKTESVVKSDIPSERAHGNNIEERELPFKKVLYGYSPDEVAAYISELNDAHEASAKLHESKLSSLKEELALSNRERDYYIQKCKSSKAEAALQPPSHADNRNDELEAVISRLKERVKELENENKILNEKPAENIGELTDTYAAKISKLEKALASSESEKLQLSQKSIKYDALFDEHKSALAQLEETKVLLESGRKELIEKEEEISEKSEKINTLSKEKENLDKKLSEGEIQNHILSQRIAEAEKEALELKESNKNLVFENAEKINKLENEYAKSKLAVQKEIKLYRYYVDRAELTVAELTKQMEQIRQSMEKSEI